MNSAYISSACFFLEIPYDTWPKNNGGYSKVSLAFIVTGSFGYWVPQRSQFTAEETEEATAKGQER